MLDDTERGQEERQRDQHPHMLLYAEYLSNIRTLSIQASLATPSNGDSKAYISDAGNVLNVEHEDEHATIRLPCHAVSGVSSLTLPAIPSTELNFRLHIEDEPNVAGPADANHVPWMAEGLTSEVELSCAACLAIFVPRCTVRIWKALPSEGWAEMMDFWHCHKPDEPHDLHTHAPENAGRGFASNSRLAVSPSVGLVGHVDLLLAGEDCYGIERSNNQAKSLQCSRCHCHVGAIDSNTNGYKLHKRCISASLRSGIESICFEVEKWLACEILTAADSQGVRRLAVYSSRNGRALSVTHLWIFASCLAVASSKAKTPEPAKVTKIFYRAGEAADLEKMNGMHGLQGDLELRTSEHQELLQALSESSLLLPAAARTFQDWNVGILRLFTREDVQLDAVR